MMESWMLGQSRQALGSALEPLIRNSVVEDEESTEVLIAIVDYLTSCHVNELDIAISAAYAFENIVKDTFVWGLADEILIDLVKNKLISWIRDVKKEIEEEAEVDVDDVDYGGTYYVDVEREAEDREILQEWMGWADECNYDDDPEDHQPDHYEANHDEDQ